MKTTSKYFPEPFMFERIAARRYRLTREFSYQYKPGCFILIEPGFITDFASVPRVFWWAYPPDGGKYTKSAVIHDAIYAAELFPRDACDSLFLEAMINEGCGWFDRNTIYGAVRSFGWITWNGHTSESRRKARKFVSIKIT